MSIVMENVRTTDNRCYVGMTKEQAQAEREKTIKLFSKLDTDKDGILSFDEVMQQRTDREDKIKTGRNIWGGITIWQGIGGISLEHQPTATKVQRVTQLLCVLAFASITVNKDLKMKKWQKQDIEYRKQYQEYLKQQEQDNKTKQTEKEIEQLQEIQKAEEDSHEIEVAA